MSIVFTSITGNYDSLKPIRVKNPNWRYIAVVDNTKIKSNGWELLHISEFKIPNGLNYAYQNRWVKIKGLEFFKKPIIYIDGSYEIIGDITELHKGDFCLKKHPVRNCVYEEAKACIRYKKANKNLILKQVEYYKKIGMPSNYGMFENGVFFMPFNNDMVGFCNDWLNEIMNHTHRDQLSITKVLWSRNIKPRVIPPEAIYNYLKLHKHN